VGSVTHDGGNPDLSMLQERGKIILRILIPILIIAAIWFTGRGELQMIDIGRTVIILQTLPGWMIISLLLAGLAAVAAITLYDLVIVRALGLQVSRVKVLQTAWVATTFNNFLGFAGLTGPAVRILFYRGQGIETRDILQLTVLLVSAALTGISGLAAAASLGLTDASAAFQVYPSLRWLLLAATAYLPLFLLAQAWPWLARKLNMGQEVPPRFLWTLITISHLQWLAAGTFFWLVSELLVGSLSLAQGLGVYTAGLVVGVVSLTPGGIGSMDLVLLMFLQRLGLAANDALSVVLLFRLNYFVFPWVAGLLLTAVSLSKPSPAEEVECEDLCTLPEGYGLWRKVWGWPAQVRYIGDVAVIILAALVFLSGIALLWAAATPDFPPRLMLIFQIFTPLMRLSHHLTVGVGVLLIVLSRRIRLRVFRAYQAVLVLLILGAVFTVLKGMNYREAIFLLLVAGLLWLTRHRFDRNNMPLAVGSFFFWLLLTAVIVFYYSQLGAAVSQYLAEVPVPDLVEGTIILPADEIRRGALKSLAVSWLVFGLWLTVRPPRIRRRI